MIAKHPNPCKHEFQDAEYGPGFRLMNPIKVGPKDEATPALPLVADRHFKPCWTYTGHACGCSAIGTTASIRSLMAHASSAWRS